MLEGEQTVPYRYVGTCLACASSTKELSNKMCINGTFGCKLGNSNPLAAYAQGRILYNIGNDAIKYLCFFGSSRSRAPTLVWGHALHTGIFTLSRFLLLLATKLIES